MKLNKDTDVTIWAIIGIYALCALIAWWTI